MKTFLRWCLDCLCCKCLRRRPRNEGPDAKGLLHASPAGENASLKEETCYYHVRRISSFGRCESKEAMDSCGDLSCVQDSENQSPSGTWASNLDTSPELFRKSPQPGWRKPPWHGAIHLIKHKRKAKASLKQVPSDIALSSPDLVHQLDVDKAAYKGKIASSSCLPSDTLTEANRLTVAHQRSRWLRSQSMESVDLGPEPSTPPADEVFHDQDSDNVARSVGLDRSLYMPSPPSRVRSENKPGIRILNKQGMKFQPKYEIKQEMKIESKSDMLSPATPVLYPVIDEYQDVSCGTITFTATYYPKNRKLCVQVNRVENLPPKDKSNSYDVIVHLTLLPAEKPVKMTQILHGSLCPVVEEDFHFSVKEPVGKVVRLSVYNAAYQGKYDAVGHALFNVEDVMNGRPQCYSTKLTKQSQPGAKPGSLQLILQYFSEEQRINILVESARNLSATHLSKSSRPTDKFSTYVKVTFHCAGVKLKTKKSTIVTSDRNPIYSYTYSFKVVPDALNESYLIVSVLLKSTLRKDVLLGRCVLGPNYFGEGQQLTAWGRAVLEKEKVRHWFQMYL